MTALYPPFAARYGATLTAELQWLGRRRRRWLALGNAIDANLARCPLPTLATIRVQCAHRVDILTARMLVKAHLRRAARALATEVSSL